MKEILAPYTHIEKAQKSFSLCNKIFSSVFVLLWQLQKKKQSVSKLSFSNFKFQEYVSLCFKERVQRVIMIIIETIEALAMSAKRGMLRFLWRQSCLWVDTERRI